MDSTVVVIAASVILVYVAAIMIKITFRTRA